MVLNLRLLHYFLHLEGHPRSLSFSVMAHPNGKEIIIADRLEDTRSGGRAMNQRFRIKDPMARPPRPGTLLSPTLGVPGTGGWIQDPKVKTAGDWNPRVGRREKSRGRGGKLSVAGGQVLGLGDRRSRPRTQKA